LDSRIVARSGFNVSTSDKRSGLQAGDGDHADISEAVESSQAVMNLAAASVKYGFDLFVTYTCNQSTHPGIRKLYEFKESMEWTEKVPGYESLNKLESENVDGNDVQQYSNSLLDGGQTVVGEVHNGFNIDETP
jgi:hypothetical protein